MKKPVLIWLLLLNLACSKDSYSDNGDNLTTISLPTALELSYNGGEQEVIYELSYNQENQINQVSIERSSDGDTTQLLANFNYNQNGTLVEVTGTSDAEQFQMVFSYNQDTIISDIDFNIGGDETNLDVLYDEIQNSYLVTYVNLNLPLSFTFDEQNRLSLIGVQENSITPSYLDFDKGVFHDVNLQPANHIWNGLFFFLAPWELYFLSERDVTRFDIENPSNPTESSNYQSKLRDGNGNLIAFQLRFGVFGSLLIDYLITYENRTF